VRADNPENDLVPHPEFEGEPEIPVDPGFEDRPGAFYFLDPQRRMTGIGGQKADLLF
jgi:hypothetical protein